MKVKCLYCDIEFNKKDSECRKYPRHFCNRKHYFEWQKEYTLAERTEKKCSNCAVVFFTRKSAGVRTLSFCTRKCQYEYFKGVKAPSYKKGRYSNDKGYILVFCKNHPRKVAKCYVYEHILVAEEVLGRFLTKGEVIHHINGIKNDNRLENLMLLPDGKTHRNIHFESSTKTQSELIREYKSLAEMSRPA